MTSLRSLFMALFREKRRDTTIDRREPLRLLDWPPPTYSLGNTYSQVTKWLNRLLSDSASVGWAKIASFKVVYGSFPIMAS